MKTQLSFTCFNRSCPRSETYWYIDYIFYIFWNHFKRLSKIKLKYICFLIRSSSTITCWIKVVISRYFAFYHTHAHMKVHNHYLCDDDPIFSSVRCQLSISTIFRKYKSFGFNLMSSSYHSLQTSVVCTDFNLSHHKPICYDCWSSRWSYSLVVHKRIEN